MAEAAQIFIITPTAGEFVAGILHGGAGTSISLTDAQARYELLLGSIVPDGTIVPIEPAPGPVNPLDRLEGTRGSKAWDVSVGELLAFLLARILPEVTETLGDVEGRILGDAALTDNTLSKLAARISALALATQNSLDLKAPRQSPEFRGQPMAPTAAPGTSSDQIATAAFVAHAIADLRLGEAATMSRDDIVELVREALGGKEF